jgi:hypothetical protein
MLFAIIIFGIICLLTTIYGGYYFDFMRNCSLFSGIKCENMTADYFNDNILRDIVAIEK